MSKGNSIVGKVIVRRNGDGEDVVTLLFQQVANMVQHMACGGGGQIVYTLAYILYHFDQFDCHMSQSIFFIADLILSQFFRFFGIFRNRKKVRLVLN